LEVLLCEAGVDADLRFVPEKALGGLQPPCPVGDLSMGA